MTQVDNAIILKTARQVLCDCINRKESITVKEMAERIIKRGCLLNLTTEEVDKALRTPLGELLV